ncbi:hypothetical protein DVA67_031870 [Solirubrobacter sp. CPCC 204708]|uniref:SGNH/GDSL hydrolase family protein n=1 Tax=Solirubrobacter deserti TaxID=2282478 RepID=A0ABT4RQ61_9ACTN|nr:hypothetical protein [Solirubrobacter deserti]MBE2320601.1 hypothetical protein [Solirubrobacter deserti]MDA0140656.1 hypothetical protein [Solirubrobacter deserti]
MARIPVFEPDLNVPVTPARDGTTKHRIVALGDSLTHGVQSGAVFNTDLAYPAIIARALGTYDRYRYPRYGGPGGLPFNIEYLLRELERVAGESIAAWEAPRALYTAWRWMDELEDYWERGAGSVPPKVAAINHALAVYGWDLRDALSMTAQRCLDRLQEPAQDAWVLSKVDRDSERAALHVYPHWPPERRTMTLLDAARALGEDGGIETLVVFLGANNALGTVTSLKVAWSGDDYADLRAKGKYTLWRPEHFRAELAVLEEQVRGTRARHVIWCTVPHVTIAPIARGVSADKMAKGSRYFAYYTRPWISDDQFDPERDPHITGDQARTIDATIDAFNDGIQATVERARHDGRDWLLLDMAGLLDRLASRRYIDDETARPQWWEPYPLPPAVAKLTPPVTSRFLTSDGHGGRATGGLFSLDGVHPTTVAYGLIAQELITVMRGVGVAVRDVDFDWLIGRDTLIGRPPQNITSGLETLGWADDALDLVLRALP